MKQYEYRPHSSKWQRVQRPEMLKIYKIGNLTYQFEEGKQPSSAVEVKKAETKNKAVKPANKSAANESVRGTRK